MSVLSVLSCNGCPDLRRAVGVGVFHCKIYPLGNDQLSIIFPNALVCRTSIVATSMAFDHPLEADRVDDLNLFSAFVRAPVVGTLMWILGGHKAREEEEEEQQRRRRLDDDMIDTKDASDSNYKSNNNNMNRSERNSNFKKLIPGKSALKKTPPSLTGSEISDGVEYCSTALDAMHLFTGGAGDSSNYFNSLNPPLKRQKKELSWSDESGQSLVKIIGEDDEVSKVTTCLSVLHN